MSRKQFDRWLRDRGIGQRNGRYYLPLAGLAKRADQDNTLTVTMSTGRRDRQGDILEPAGADLSAFRKNPVVLWAHRYDELPIGRADEVQVQGNGIRAKIIFDSRGFAREVFRLYAEGFLAGWSVGCLPRKWKVINDEDGRFAGYHVTEWELLELSAVPVPANPEAITHELRDGRIADPLLCKSIGELLNGDPAAADSERPPAPTAAADPAEPEILTAALADTLFPPLMKRMREWARQAAAREIRRRQGRVN